MAKNPLKDHMIIGLTGGIGSGKSTVARLFATLGIPIVDTDVIAHQLTQPGSKTVNDIQAAFSTPLLIDNTTLDRAKLRELVFHNPQARKKLEAILHPVIFQQTCAQLKKNQSNPSSYQIVVVPLLVENLATWKALTHRILVIDCPESIQIQRVKTRNGFSTALIQHILRSQAPRLLRLSYADNVILNDKNTPLQAAVQHLHAKYELGFSPFNHSSTG